jgi:xanthine dehydrogenase YagT iron-sulfur-binding subunit
MPESEDSKEMNKGLFSRRQLIRGAAIPAASAAVLDQLASPARGQTHDPRVSGPAPTLIQLSVNGETFAVRVDPETTLVDVLREQLELTGTKIGCNRGACSACTVWLDGEVAASCMTFALDARGRQITTIEGLSKNGTLHPIQQAFVEHDAMQCGFCTPGMVMSCAALLKRKPQPALDDVKKAVSGNLCRCGTYNNIFKAVLSVGGRSQNGD